MNILTYLFGISSKIVYLCKLYKTREKIMEDENDLMSIFGSGNELSFDSQYLDEDTDDNDENDESSNDDLDDKNKPNN